MSFRSYDLLKLVQEFGQDATLKKNSTQGTYNPATGSVEGSVTTSYPIQAYFYNYENGLSLSQDEVRRGVRKCLISAVGLTVVPDDEDQILGSGDAVSILSVVTIYSSGSPVCYICDVRE